MHGFWRSFTSFGDSGFLLPTALLLALWLFIDRHSRRAAMQWVLMFGACGFVVMVSKIAFMGWGIGVQSVEFAGFSGHAMRAGAVFPVAGFLAFRSSPPPARLLATAFGVLLAVLIAVSRVYIRVHSVSEVVTGCLLGLAVAALFIWYAGNEHHMALSRVLVALCLPVLLLAPRVEPIPTETWIAQAALYLSGRDHPYTRAIWRAPRPRVL